MDGPAEAGPDGSTAEPSGQSLGQRVWEQVSTLTIAVVVALSIRAFVIEPFRIPSESMLPTLLIGDHLFVNKFVYGVRIPFTDLRLPALREPERGDVVVFEVARGGPSIHPADKRPDLPRDDFVKRIVGLPGDVVEIDGDRVRVNGEELPTRDLGEQFRDEDGRLLDVWSEDLTGCRHAVLDNPRERRFDRKRVVVPEDRYFMMGDNRDHSNDSRGWGTVHFDQFKGPAFVLYWSWSVDGNVLQFLNPANWWYAEKRWGRVFQRVRCDPGAPSAPPPL